jgi:hypothetical protein
VAPGARPGRRPERPHPCCSRLVPLSHHPGDHDRPRHSLRKVSRAAVRVVHGLPEPGGSRGGVPDPGLCAACSGHTYERSAIQAWLQEHDTCPASGAFVFRVHPFIHPFADAPSAPTRPAAGVQLGRDHRLVANHALRGVLPTVAPLPSPPTPPIDELLPKPATQQVRVIGQGGVPATSQVRVLEGHTDDVHCVAWSPDGSRVATASWDETVALWDPATGQRLRVNK